MSLPRALVVDDEPDIRELLELTLSRMDISCRSTANIDEARKALNEDHFDLCLTDMRLPDGNGIDLVEYIQRFFPDLPTAVITAHGNMESAVRALKAGAFDFVSKPVDLHILRDLAAAAIKSRPGSTRDAGPMLLGNTAAMQETRATIAKLARSQAPVYISGESGTGKELAAAMIHHLGPRAEGPFIPVNCGAIPEALMESEFFGHRRGSFTGATSDKIGLFEAARGGTLFLDEVADLPQHMQVKLLRAIQEKAIRPVGEHRERPIDVRILSATHKDLEAMVLAGHFRQDLFYRINVITLDLPPLRDRADDIPLLADHILRRLAETIGNRAAFLTDAAIARLRNYAFPGNVRELENILERATAFCENDRIGPEDLQLRSSPEPTALNAPDLGMPLDPMLGHMERDTIEKALEQTRYNKTAAAKLLGISFSALRYRLKKLGLE
ncbi:MAG: response regulator [Gammaproteobacteria bacterium]|nr:response regulator [Gammaproteobacteria bacterium]